MKFDIKPDIDYINNILLNFFQSYTAMRALECFLTQQVHSQAIIKKGQNPIFPRLRPTWTKHAKKIGEGTYGKVDLYTIFEKSLVVVKTTKDKGNYILTKKEYEIGVNVLNSLRYHCPNFCYTLCSFEHPKLGPSICYEYVGRKNLFHFLYKSSITLRDFFPVLIQILSALEIAQKESRFGHFDLSPNNIMIRDDLISYSVNIDDKTIHYKDVYCPVIIDYGLSSAFVDGKKYSPYLEAFDEGEYGKYSFLVQGFDMFFIMADLCIYGGNANVKAFMKDVVTTFYGTTPYNLNTAKDSVNYWAAISRTASANFTPGSMLKNIIKKYPMYLTDKITIVDRKTYDINSFSELGPHLKSITNIGLTTLECFNKCNSYIMYIYYANDEPKEKYSMMDNDRILLSMYKDIVIPKNIVDYCEKFLGYKLTKIPTPDDYIKRLDFIEEIQVYVDIYYMIMQIQPQDKIYTDFYTSFGNSDIFKFYKDFGPLVFAAKRWIITLKDYTNIKS